MCADVPRFCIGAVGPASGSYYYVTSTLRTESASQPTFQGYGVEQNDTSIKWGIVQVGRKQISEDIKKLTPWNWSNDSMVKGSLLSL